MKEKQSSLSHSEALEQLAHIRTVTAEKRQYGYYVSPYFLIWGVIWFVTFTLQAVNLLPQSVIGMIWTVTSIVGVTLSIFAPWEWKGKPLVPRLLVVQMRFAWVGWFLTVAIFVFLVAVGALSFSFQLLSLYAVLLVAIMYFLIGIVLGREVFFMGMWLFMLAVVTALFFSDLMSLIFGVIGGGSFIVVGLLLRHKGKTHA